MEDICDFFRFVELFAQCVDSDVWFRLRKKNDESKSKT